MNIEECYNALNPRWTYRGHGIYQGTLSLVCTDAIQLTSWDTIELFQGSNIYVYNATSLNYFDGSLIQAANLSQLSLIKCALTSSGFTNMDNARVSGGLWYLDLRQNFITTLDFLSSCKKLQQVWLSQNCISDLSVFAGLTDGLASLDIAWQMDLVFVQGCGGWGTYDGTYPGILNLVTSSTGYTAETNHKLIGDTSGLNQVKWYPTASRSGTSSIRLDYTDLTDISWIPVHSAPIPEYLTIYISSKFSPKLDLTTRDWSTGPNSIDFRYCDFEAGDITALANLYPYNDPGRYISLYLNYNRLNADTDATIVTLKALGYDHVDSYLKAYYTPQFPASSLGLWVKSGGAWQQAKEEWIKVNGAWQQVKEHWVKVNGVWQKGSG